MTAFADGRRASRLAQSWLGALECVELLRTCAATMKKYRPEAMRGFTGQVAGSGAYTLADWLRYNANHRHVHAAQIRDTVRLLERR